MTRTIVIIYRTLQFIFTQSISVKSGLFFTILSFLPQSKITYLLKDRFFKKMLLKRARTSLLFFAKQLAQIIILLDLKSTSVFFNVAKFEFKVTTNYGLWKKNTPRCDTVCKCIINIALCSTSNRITN